MFKKVLNNVTLAVATILVSSNCYADNYNSIYKTASALSFGAFKQGSTVISTTKPKRVSNRRSRSATLPSVVVKSVNKTIPCPAGGTLTAKGRATVDTTLKTFAMNSSLTLKSCNAVSGRGSSYLSASQSGSLISYSASVPASKYTGKCEDGSAGTFLVNKLAVVGQYDQSTRINNATISGSFSAVCGSATKFSCNWPTPVPLSDRTAVMSYCTPAQ